MSAPPLPPPSSARVTLALVTGLAMIAMGLVIVARPLCTARPALTSSAWMDGAFALFFLVRGLMNVRSARQGARHRRDA